MNKTLWILLAFAAGAILPLQAGLNARLGKAANSPVHASAISFLVGLAGLLIYLIITQQQVSVAGLKAAPWYVWAGGLLGAFYVTVIVVAFPHLGPSLTFGLVIAGQLLISALLEHFNILVNQASPINLYKLLGFALIIVGVIIIKKH